MPCARLLTTPARGLLAQGFVLRRSRRADACFPRHWTVSAVCAGVAPPPAARAEGGRGRAGWWHRPTPRPPSAAILGPSRLAPARRRRECRLRSRGLRSRRPRRCCASGPAPRRARRPARAPPPRLLPGAPRALLVSPRGRCASRRASRAGRSPGRWGVARREGPTSAAPSLWAPGPLDPPRAGFCASLTRLPSGRPRRLAALGRGARTHRRVTLRTEAGPLTLLRTPSAGRGRSPASCAAWRAPRASRRRREVPRRPKPWPPPGPRAGRRPTRLQLRSAASTCCSSVEPAARESRSAGSPSLNQCSACSTTLFRSRPHRLPLGTRHHQRPLPSDTLNRSTSAAAPVLRGRLGELERRQQMLCVTHPRQRTIGAIVEDRTHRRLLGTCRLPRPSPCRRALGRSSAARRSSLRRAQRALRHCRLPVLLRAAPRGLGALWRRARSLRRFPPRQARPDRPASPSGVLHRSRTAASVVDADALGAYARGCPR